MEKCEYIFESVKIFVESMNAYVKVWIYLKVWIYM